MAATFYGVIPGGITEPLELSGFPEGRAKIRMRQDDFVTVAVKTADGIRVFYPKEQNGKWVPCVEKARNQRI